MTREEVAMICKAMSDTNRLRIIEMLTHGKWQHYSINCETFKAYKDYIAGITCCETKKGALL